MIYYDEVWKKLEGSNGKVVKDPTHPGPYTENTPKEVGKYEKDLQ